MRRFPKSNGLQKKGKLKQQGKDRDQDACDICLIQTVKLTHIVGNHMLATHCMQGLGAMMGGGDCSGPCFCWFSAKNEGLHEMVIPKLPFTKNNNNKSKVVYKTIFIYIDTYITIYNKQISHTKRIPYEKYTLGANYLY